MSAFRAWIPGAVLVLLLAAPAAPAAVFVALVGDDAACGFRTSVLSNALQAAIDAVPTAVAPGDLYVVRVARNGNYAGTRVSILGRSLRIEGGYTSCSATTPSASNTAIDATGTVGGPIRIDGTTSRSSVALANLTVLGGSGPVGSGVSIRNADVLLTRVTATANSALRGGGIDVEGGGFGARATLDGATLVIANTATQEGGGISCTRGAVLEIATTVEVNGNIADTSGGGIYMNGCTGYANLGARFNEAAQGGFLFARSSLSPTVFTFGSGLGPDDRTPALLANAAEVGGGAIFATGIDTEITLNDVQIQGNRAGSIGGGIVVNSDAVVEMQRVRRLCPRRDRCSLLADNTANYGGGGLANVRGTLVVRRTSVEGNTGTLGGSAFSAQGSGGFVSVRNSLVTGNSGPTVFQVRNPLAEGSARLEIDQTTVVANVGATEVVRVNNEGSVRIAKSIVNEPAARPVFALFPGYAPETYCSMFHETASAGTVDTLTIAFTAPGFVDAAGGNYHLRATAEATDRCPAGTGSDPVDLDGDPRPLEGPLANLAGPFDVGYDEYDERFFADGFEG